ncbi:hypothetical protein GQ54DRAFT_143943 [Martensiomyces pterosporus]|nr:hypothetical protein GQ54DRAFT_143943 [Martensiomyces pterosporus]
MPAITPGTCTSVISATQTSIGRSVAGDTDSKFTRCIFGAASAQDSPRKNSATLTETPTRRGIHAAASHIQIGSHASYMDPDFTPQSHISPTQRNVSPSAAIASPEFLSPSQPPHQRTRSTLFGSGANSVRGYSSGGTPTDSDDLDQPSPDAYNSPLRKKRRTSIIFELASESPSAHTTLQSRAVTTHTQVADKLLPCESPLTAQHFLLPGSGHREWQHARASNKFAASHKQTGAFIPESQFTTPPTQLDDLDAQTSFYDVSNVVPETLHHADGETSNINTADMAASTDPGDGDQHSKESRESGSAATKLTLPQRAIRLRYSDAGFCTQERSQSQGPNGREAARMAVIWQNADGLQPGAPRDFIDTQPEIQARDTEHAHLSPQIQSLGDTIASPDETSKTEQTHGSSTLSTLTHRNVQQTCIEDGPIGLSNGSFIGQQQASQCHRGSRRRSSSADSKDPGDKSLVLIHPAQSNGKDRVDSAFPDKTHEPKCEGPNGAGKPKSRRSFQPLATMDSKGVVSRTSPDSTRSAALEHPRPARNKRHAKTSISKLVPAGSSLLQSRTSGDYAATSGATTLRSLTGMQQRVAKLVPINQNQEDGRRSRSNSQEGAGACAQPYPIVVPVDDHKDGQEELDAGESTPVLDNELSSIEIQNDALLDPPGSKSPLSGAQGQSPKIPGNEPRDHASSEAKAASLGQGTPDRQELHASSQLQEQELCAAPGEKLRAKDTAVDMPKPQRRVISLLRASPSCLSEKEGSSSAEQNTDMDGLCMGSPSSCTASPEPDGHTSKTDGRRRPSANPASIYRTLAILRSPGLLLSPRSGQGPVGIHMDSKRLGSVLRATMDAVRSISSAESDGHMPRRHSTNKSPLSTTPTKPKIPGRGVSLQRGSRSSFLSKSELPTSPPGKPRKRPGSIDMRVQELQKRHLKRRLGMLAGEAPLKPVQSDVHCCLPAAGQMQAVEQSSSSENAASRWQRTWRRKSSKFLGAIPQLLEDGDELSGAMDGRKDSSAMLATAGIACPAGEVAVGQCVWALLSKDMRGATRRLSIVPGNYYRAWVWKILGREQPDVVVEFDYSRGSTWTLNVSSIANFGAQPGGRVLARRKKARKLELARTVAPLPPGPSSSKHVRVCFELDGLTQEVLLCEIALAPSMLEEHRLLPQPGCAEPTTGLSSSSDFAGRNEHLLPTPGAPARHVDNRVDSGGEPCQVRGTKRPKRPTKKTNAAWAGHQPPPPTSADGQEDAARIFEGLYFMITVAENNAPGAKASSDPDADPARKRSTLSWTKASKAQTMLMNTPLPSRCALVMDRTRLTAWIAERGGTVISDHEQCANMLSDWSRLEQAGIGGSDLAGHPGVFLIADKASTTAKYLTALALGIPRVSGVWISECVMSERLEDYRPFQLTSGWSEELGAMCASPFSPGFFKGISVLVYGTAQFQRNWARLLSLAGATVTTPPPSFSARSASRLRQSPPPRIVCDYVLTEKAPRKGLRARVSQFCVRGSALSQAQWNTLALHVGGSPLKDNGLPPPLYPEPGSSGGPSGTANSSSHGATSSTPEDAGDGVADHAADADSYCGAEARDAPWFVSHRWARQCLINQRVLRSNGHPSYSEYT